MCNHSTQTSGASPRASKNADARVGAGVDGDTTQVSGIHSEPVAGAVLGPTPQRVTGWSRIGVFWRTTVCWVALIRAVGCQPARADDPTYVSCVVDAIYRVEGGDKTKHPYGIKSVKVSGKAEARRVCENTVRNNLARWRKAGAKGDYLDFLADRYCPPTADPKGNFRWKKNIHQIITCPNSSAETPLARKTIR